METHGALIAVIGDEETVTGMLLAGVGNVDARRTSNFMVVDSSELRLTTTTALPTPVLTSARPRVHAETTPAQIEDAFKRFTSRSDVAIVLINQYVRRRPRREGASVCGSLLPFAEGPPPPPSPPPPRSVPTPCVCAPQIAGKIRPVIEAYTLKSPCILEIPSKAHHDVDTWHTAAFSSWRPPASAILGQSVDVFCLAGPTGYRPCFPHTGAPVLTLTLTLTLALT